MKMVTGYAGLDSFFFEDIPLRQLEQNIAELITKYGKDAFIDVDYGWEGEIVSLRISYEREETEAEKARRIKKKAKEKEQKATEKEKKKENELKQLERLAAKYGKRLSA